METVQQIPENYFIIEEIETKLLNTNINTYNEKKGA